MSVESAAALHPAASPLRRAVKDILAGTAGGIGLTLVGHPFDTLKVRLQTQSHTNPIYSSLLDCVQKTYRAEGLVGFYRGVASPLIGQVVFNAVQFMAYTKAKELVSGGQPGAQLTIPQYFAAGAITGAIVALIETPIDLVKTQLQTQVFQEKPAFTSLPQTVRFVTSTNGLLGVYQGFLPTLARNIPAVSCYFGVYETVRRMEAEARGVSVEQLTAAELLIAGSIGGLSYWIGTFPIDAIKSTIQADNVEKSKRRYSGVVDAARGMWAEGGVGRFFKGITPCLMRAAPANAVCFFLYERSIKLLDQYF